MNFKSDGPKGRRNCFYRIAGLLAWSSVLSSAGEMLASAPAWADPQPVTIQGIPQQVMPQADEVGLGGFTLPTGTTSILSGSGSGGSSSGGTGSSTSSTALDTMMGTSWGSVAAENAQALGVNSTALAATCVIESGCQNVQGTGSITGAFQMSSSTYTASLAQALAQDPNLANNIVPGLAGQNDPATQSIAAAEYLKQGAEYLQNNEISDPTVLDVRGYYNFGPQGGAALANAPDSNSIASTLSMYTPSQLSQNGITPGETVGQWKAGVAAKLGNAAAAPVLS